MAAMDTGYTQGSRFAWALPGLSLAAFAAASLVLFSERVPMPGKTPDATGKALDRLSFVQENVPTRQTRIYDTLAMFSLPRAEPVAWSEAPLAGTKVQDVTTVGALREPMARTVAADAANRVATILPPARPVLLASTAVTPRPARSGPVPSLIQPLAVASADPAIEPPSVRMPVQVLGVTLPGTQYLPTGRDTLRTLSAIGSRTRELGADAGSAVGGAFFAATDAITETVGLR